MTYSDIAFLLVFGLPLLALVWTVTAGACLCIWRGMTNADRPR